LFVVRFALYACMSEDRSPKSIFRFVEIARVRGAGFSLES